MIRLTAVVDGEARPWTEDDLAEVEPVTIDEAGADRDAFSLRTLAAELVGPGAAVVEVRGETTTMLDAEAWADASRVPVLKLNRRGMLKLVWLDPGGQPTAGAEVRGVTELTFTTK